MQDLQGKSLEIKNTSSLDKTIVELKIKDLFNKNLHHGVGIPVSTFKKNFPEKAAQFEDKIFTVVVVRNPKYQDEKSVAISFLYKDGNIYIQDILRDTNSISSKYRFLIKHKRNDRLIDNQLFFVDEANQICLSSYTDPYYTPLYLGGTNILTERRNETLQLSRGPKKNTFLPLVLYYNQQDRDTTKNMICLDLSQDNFIQYFVPPSGPLRATLKKGFRIYHLLGYYNTGQSINSKLTTYHIMQQPLTYLFFSTITQNILKISENSQSPILKKFARILIDN